MAGQVRKQRMRTGCAAQHRPTHRCTSRRAHTLGTGKNRTTGKTAADPMWGRNPTPRRTSLTGDLAGEPGQSGTTSAMRRSTGSTAPRYRAACTTTLSATTSYATHTEPPEVPCRLLLSQGGWRHAEEDR